MSNPSSSCWRTGFAEATFPPRHRRPSSAAAEAPCPWAGGSGSSVFSPHNARVVVRDCFPSLLGEFAIAQSLLLSPGNGGVSVAVLFGWARICLGARRESSSHGLRGFTSIVLSRCQLVPLKPMGLSLRLSIDQSKTLRKL